MVNPVTVTRHESVALVALNNPPVNALSHAVRVELLALLQALFVAPDVDAIILACEGRTFIAGADIREFGKAPLAPDLPELVEFIDSSPKLTLAAMHGTALGGGLELALACHIRLATASAKLGLPEVTLGILPGAGGTQRLPRLIGVRRALDLIVSGTLISATEAQRLGLVDEIIGDDVKQAALVVARRLLAERRPHRRASALTATLDSPELFAEYEHGIQQRCRGFLAPFRCIEAVRAAVELPFDEGLERERTLFRELMASAESKAQRHLFFGEREVAKVPDVAEDTPIRPLKSVALFGEAPAMSELARSFADARIPVTLLADEPSELARCLEALQQGYGSAVDRGRVSRAEADARIELVRPASSHEEARSADLLLEAVADDLEKKRIALARLDAVAKPAAILGTTTSSLSLDVLAAATQRPADVVGMHFPAPLAHGKLLEAVRGPQTAADAFATIVKLARSLGKVAVPVRGHVAQRLLARCAREASLLCEEGAAFEVIERTLTEFGFPESFCGRLAALRERRPDHRASATGDIASEEIRERCLFSVVNEGARALADGSVARPLDIDMIWVQGFGFPVYRGGPLFFADQVGLRHVYERIQRYCGKLGEEHWSPAPLIERLALEGRGFYGQP